MCPGRSAHRRKPRTRVQSYRERLDWRKGESVRFGQSEKSFLRTEIHPPRETRCIGHCLGSRCILELTPPNLRRLPSAWPTRRGTGLRRARQRTARRAAARGRGGARGGRGPVERRHGRRSVRMKGRGGCVRALEGRRPGQAGRPPAGRNSCVRRPASGVRRPASLYTPDARALSSQYHSLVSVSPPCSCCLYHHPATRPAPIPASSSLQVRAGEADSNSATGVKTDDVAFRRTISYEYGRADMERTTRPVPRQRVLSDARSPQAPA